MRSDYSVTVHRDDAAEPVDAAEIARIDPNRLASLMAELSRKDPGLRRRLKEIAGGNGAAARPAAEPVAARPARMIEEAPRVERERPRDEPAATAPVPSQDAGFEYMVGNSTAARRVFEAIRRYAGSSAPVLLTGESGTGKELAARAIHERSPWSRGPFVPINCGALPTTLIASELFGYEKGAFTGASGRKIGRIETAEGGTVFLDEIGDLPLETQVHLLRFLQEQTIERVGGNKSITVNARVIAATNVNLREAVAKGRFREDLFYRLNVLPLEMPRLRDRGDDVMLLAKFFLQQFAKEIGREGAEYSPDAQAAIMAHPWPGNIRELIGCVRRAVVMSDGHIIRADDLGLGHGHVAPSMPEQGLGKARAEAEASLIRGALERNKFNIKRSAAELGVSRVTLYRLIQRHDIQIVRGDRVGG